MSLGSTRSEYREYIEQLTQWADEDPEGYKRRVILLVLKGYGFIFGLLLLLLLALAALVAVAVMSQHASVVLLKLGFPLAALAFIFIRSLWIRLPEPEGAIVAERETPELHAMIERVRARLGAPRPHAVLRTSEFNASVIQIPRYGLFGGTRSYVILGVPLLEALPPAEFEAVLAHEFGHLAGEHGRFNAWIYSMRGSWGRILAQMEASPSGMNLVKGFLKGFVPEFDATTFVMARRHEYEADRAAAAATDARTIGSVLIRLELMARARVDRFGASVSERVAREPSPPEDILGDEILMFRSGLDSETARAWLKDALARPTDLEDTHPALADRLGALGVDPASLPAAPPVERSAAEALAGPVRETWRREINERWFAANFDGWREQHAATIRAREAHQKWKARAAAGSLPSAEQFGYAVSLLNHEGIDAATAHLRPWVNAEPNDLHSRRMLGELLLGRDDESGLEHLRAVVAGEPAIAVESCQRAYEWLFQRGRREEADEWFELQRQCVGVFEQGRLERQVVSASDEFLPHELPEEIVGPIRSAALAMEGVSSVWLVRKRLTVVPDEPLWLLFLDPRWNRVSFGRDDRARKILTQAATTIPPINPSIQVVLTPPLAPLRAKLEAIEGARLR